MVQGTCMSGAFGGLHAGGVWGVRRDADKTQEADEQNGPRSRLQSQSSGQLRGRTKIRLFPGQPNGALSFQGPDGESLRGVNSPRMGD